MTTTGLNTSQIRVAGTGSIWKAPLGTVLPTDSVAAWGAGFVNLGYAKAGFTVTPSLKTSPVMGWQSTNVLRNIVTELTRKYAFELQQTNADTLALAWGGTVVPGTAGAYTIDVPNEATIGECIIGIDWSDGASNQRIIVQRAGSLTLPPIKGDRTAETTYALEFQELVPGDGTSGVLIYGVDAAVGGA